MGSGMTAATSRQGVPSGAVKKLSIFRLLTSSSLLSVPTPRSSVWLRLMQSITCGHSTKDHRQRRPDIELQFISVRLYSARLCRTLTVIESMGRGLSHARVCWLEFSIGLRE